MTYEDVGATRDERLPRGYRYSRREIRLGSDFDRAAAALRGWAAHLGAGAEIVPDAAPIESGGTILVVLRLAPLWAVAPCRIVYLIDERDRFGFAYGTLPDHPETGESAFTVSRDATGAAFRIISFSRPADPLARLASPVTRRVQRRVETRYLDALAYAASSASR